MMAYDPKAGRDRWQMAARPAAPALVALLLVALATSCTSRAGLQAVASWQEIGRSISGSILFTNRGTAAVTLQGRPRAEIVDDAGHTQPALDGEWQGPTGAPDPLVVLQPGQQAQVPFIWANYCTMGEIARGARLSLRVTLPDGRQLTAPLLDAAGRPLDSAPECNAAPVSVMTVGVFQTVGEGATPVPFPTLTEWEIPRLTWLHMVDATSGWATTESSVLRTSSGGHYWIDVTPLQGTSFVSGTASYALAGLGCFDQDHAWLAYGSDPRSPMLVFRTADGGFSWEESAVPAGALGGRFSFLDRRRGWLLLDQGAGAAREYVSVLTTRDGGASWTLASAGDPSSPAPGALPSTGLKTGLGARDPLSAWVTGSAPVDGHVYLYATFDGGRTWEDQPVALPTGYERAQSTSEPPVFTSDGRGAFAATFQSGSCALVLYQTQDGGESWTPTRPLAPGGSATFLATLDGPDRAWAIAAPSEDGGGEVYRTRDGGKTWEQLTPNRGLEEVSQLGFAGPDTGFALGPGFLLKTTDGGQTWAPLKPQLAPGV